MRRMFSHPRLSLMMFLQYAIWGAWAPALAGYLESPTGVLGVGSGTDLRRLSVGPTWWLRSPEARWRTAGFRPRWRWPSFICWARDFCSGWPTPRP